jgi:hypothetical protein
MIMDFDRKSEYESQFISFFVNLLILLAASGSAWRCQVQSRCLISLFSAGNFKFH